LLCASPAYAEGRFTVSADYLARHAESNPLALGSADGRKAANISSWAIVGAEGAWYGTRIWGSSDGRKHRMMCEGLKMAATSLTVHGLKLLVHRERPDGSDDRSFPSGHTAWAALMNPGGWGYLFPLTVGAGRLLANRHYASDVFAGFGIGEALRLIPCGVA